MILSKGNYKVNIFLQTQFQHTISIRIIVSPSLWKQHKKPWAWSDQEQRRQKIYCTNIFDLCNTQAKNKREQPSHCYKIIKHGLCYVGNNELVTIKKVHKMINCGKTIKFIALPRVAAKMVAVKKSITALENNIVKSPEIPSLITPNILLPLAQNVTATIR